MQHFIQVVSRYLVPILIFALFLSVLLSKSDPEPTEFDLKQSELLEQRANRPRQPLLITPIKKESDMGVMICTQKGKTLFFFDAKINRGEIILNSKEYLLNRATVTAKSGHYMLGGSGVSIVTTMPSMGRMKDNDDCSYITFPYMIIAVGTDSTVLKEVEIQNCPHIIRGPGAR